MDPRMYPIGNGYAPNPYEEYPGAFKSKSVSADATLAEADSGQVLHVKGNVTLTLPSTVVGMSFVVLNCGGGVVKISPAAADKVMGGGFTSADNKDISSKKKGDVVRLVADGVNGWFIQEMRGSWAYEA